VHPIRYNLRHYCLLINFISIKFLLQPVFGSQKTHPQTKNTTQQADIKPINNYLKKFNCAKNNKKENMKFSQKQTR